MNIVKWGLSLAVGGFLIVFGITKFIPGAAHIFPLIEMNAKASGVPAADLLFPVVNYIFGLSEIVLGVLVILPKTRASLGVKLAMLPFLGAILFHLSPFLGVITPAAYEEGAAGLEAALASGTGFEAAHFSSETGPALFILAIVFFTLSAANFVLHRRDV